MGDSKWHLTSLGVHWLTFVIEIEVRHLSMITKNIDGTDGTDGTDSARGRLFLIVCTIRAGH